MSRQPRGPCQTAPICGSCRRFAYEGEPEEATLTRSSLGILLQPRRRYFVIRGQQTGSERVPALPRKWPSRRKGVMRKSVRVYRGELPMTRSRSVPGRESRTLITPPQCLCHPHPPARDHAPWGPGGDQPPARGVERTSRRSTRRRRRRHRTRGEGGKAPRRMSLHPLLIPPLHSWVPGVVIPSSKLLKCGAVRPIANAGVSGVLSAVDQGLGLLVCCRENLEARFGGRDFAKRTCSPPPAG